jgi:hypothetical protein
MVPYVNVVLLGESLVFLLFLSGVTTGSEIRSALLLLFFDSARSSEIIHELRTKTRDDDENRISVIYTYDVVFKGFVYAATKVFRSDTCHMVRTYESHVKGEKNTF